MNARFVYKAAQIDPATRLEALIKSAEPRIRRAFETAVLSVRNQFDLELLADLLEQGRFDEALAMVQSIPEAVAAQVNTEFITSGVSTATVVTTFAQSPQTFNQTNERAVNTMRNNRLDLIRGFTQDQTVATRNALISGIQRGVNPREQARNFRDSIGLTARQQQAVDNYRRLLEEDPREALTRQLRDRRFDSTVRNAANNDVPLTQAQIDNMVERYNQRYIKYRSETIARTEALRAVHEGSEEMYQQAFDSGAINPDELESTWSTARDSRVRESHNGMNGQKRATGVPFVSDFGNLLRYPGDPRAPASEVIQCRCAVTRRFVRTIEPV